jgi:hypothetical protein
MVEAPALAMLHKQGPDEMLQACLTLSGESATLSKNIGGITSVLLLYSVG